MATEGFFLQQQQHVCVFHDQRMSAAGSRSVSFQYFSVPLGYTRSRDEPNRYLCLFWPHSSALIPATCGAFLQTAVIEGDFTFCFLAAHL